MHCTMNTACDTACQECFSYPTEEIIIEKHILKSDPACCYQFLARTANLKHQSCLTWNIFRVIKLKAEIKLRVWHGWN
ncbi:hypothetical protein L798_08962 [Zootermopsis nevadensis]|uniref:Uncharacterized protein n=1 Tax=Zootermopsis nevadensis TaxID=136037 RepID=A0A067RW97_ZOONE|nr:hypothetical protein L798_08962 [Zootermopsis nevadensis]